MPRRSDTWIRLPDGFFAAWLLDPPPKIR